MNEAAAIVQRYARRADAGHYHLTSPDMLYAVYEYERVLARWLRPLFNDLTHMRVLEVGCGSGWRLAHWLKLGIQPEHLTGIELLPACAAEARRWLPATVSIITGDATAVDIPPASQDVVCQFTVFSSLLEDRSQEELARTMWSWLRPGGAIVWYDFVYNNPQNPDVRGVPRRRIAQLFPDARSMRTARVTLAPPIARRLPERCLSWCNLPCLRTHVLAWIQKTSVWVAVLLGEGNLPAYAL
jgi:SAM-dependent methyltransferase